jgi:hypothetical protein
VYINNCSYKENVFYLNLIKIVGENNKYVTVMLLILLAEAALR